MNFIVENLGLIIVILVNVVLLTGSYYRIRARVEHVERDIEDIETTRASNVKALREIYDSKVEGAINHATNLFKIRDGELKELAHRMGALEIKFDRQSELMNEKFNTLIKSNAIIEAHIKTCPVKK